MLSLTPLFSLLAAAPERREVQPTALPLVEGPLPVVAADEPGTVPNVVGLSAREATRKLAQFGIAPRMDGDGFVTRQEPAPGTPVTADTVCRLTLERAPVRLTASAGQP